MEKNHKKIFSKIGFSLVVIILLVYGLQLLTGAVLGMMPKGAERISSSTTALMLLTFLPQYVVAFPVGIMMLKKLPDPSICHSKESYSIAELVKYGLMCLPVMFLGNIVGTLLSNIFSAGQATNAIESLITGNVGIEFIFMVILAPFFEEYVFRKLIIDKTLGYGEKTAILLSAVTFGLIHGNLFQFFYAFGIGLIFAYIYVKTGNFFYSFGLHAFINFIGGIVPSLLLKALGQDSIKTLVTMDLTALGENAEMVAIYGVYLIIYYVFMITGIILLIKNRKKFSLESKEGETAVTAKIVYLNPGMLVFFCMMVVIFIFMLMV